MTTADTDLRGLAGSEAALIARTTDGPSPAPGAGPRLADRIVGLFRDAVTAQAARWRLWAPVFLGMGGALYFGLRFEPAAWPAWIAAVLATAAAILLSRRNFTGAARAVALVLCLVLGFAVTKARADRVAGPIALAGMRPTMVEGWVLDVDSPGANGPRVLLATTRIDGLAPEVTPVRMRLTVKGEAPAPGIAIRAFALVNPPPQPASPGAFDFARGAWFEGVGAVAFALSPAREAYLQRPPWRLQMVMRLNAMRYGLAQRVRGAMGGGEAGAVGAAMVTGHEAWITPETTQAMRDSGLAHILSISGLHMAIVGGFAFFAVRLGVAAFPWLALRVPGKKVAAVAGAVAVGVYLLASGAPAPAERSAIVAWAAFAAILLDRRALSMNALALAALVVLLRRPESVVQAGFQMSFAATAGLVALAEVWPARSKEINAPWPIVAVQRLAWWAGVAIMVSLVAGLATGPFAMQHFNRVAMYGLGANIAVEPISSLLMMPALALGAMLTPLGLGEPFLILARWGVEAMLAIGRFFGELPGAVRVVASAPAAALPVSFLGVLFLCLWRGPLRWLGLPFAAAVLLWPRPIPPDIWIGAEGNNAALRAGEQAIIVRPEVRQFATDLWTRRYALSPAASTTQACGRFSCVTEVGGTRLALWWGTRPPTSAALASFCQSAEVVSVRPKVSVLPEACRSRLVIDGRDREGGGAVELYRHGDAWAARWAQPIRGDRPWARRPGPAPELSDSAG